MQVKDFVETHLGVLAPGVEYDDETYGDLVPKKMVKGGKGKGAEPTIKDEDNNEEIKGDN